MDEWSYVVQIIVIIVFLGICAMFDLKYKMIPVILIRIFSISSILIFILFYRVQYKNHLLGVCVGLLVLIISKVTKERIGMGDGMLLLCLGLLLGIREIGLLFLIAILLGAFWSMILITFRKANRNTTFPFVPFLLISYILCLIK